MADKIEDGGPAFPVREHSDRNPGMSLRDYFAIHIGTDGIELTSISDAAAWMGVLPPEEDDFFQVLEFAFKIDAFMRFKKADAMLKARKGEL